MAESASVKGLWQGLTTAQRGGIAIAMIGALAFVGFLSWFGNRPEWRVVVRDAEPRDAADMVAALEQASIPVQVTGGGTAIAVSADRVSDAFREFAKKQLPKSGVGLEIFDATTLSWTSFLEQTNLRRGTQGEIERTLRTWPGIASAKVLISSEKQGIWTRGEKDGTASVSVATKPGSRLTPGDVSAIQSFVASTWSSLKADRVTVVVDGQRLTRDPQGDGEKAEIAQATDQLLAKAEMESLLRRKAQDALDAAEGPGKTVVSVNADLDFESREERSSTIDPDSKVTLKEETSSTTRSGGEAPTPGGAAGASANLPSADGKTPPAAPAAAQAPLDKTETGRNDYEYSRTTKTLRKNGFDVKRISVALLADKSLAPRLPKLEGIVKVAVGFDPERRDQFSSSAEAEFPKPVADGGGGGGGAVPSGQPLDSSNLIPLIETGGRVAVLLGLVTMFLLLLKRANRRAAAAPRTAAPAGAPAGATADVAVGAPAGPSPEQAARSLAKNAASAALSDPSTAGRVLRNWIETDGR